MNRSACPSQCPLCCSCADHRRFLNSAQQTLQALKYFCKVIDGMIKELSKQVEAFGNSSYGSQVEALTVLLCLKVERSIGAEIRP